MNYTEKKVLSSDGIHRLSGRVYLPHGHPKGYFHVVHGKTEHIGRYEHFMQQMAADGYICFGYDHLGHGMTATPHERGFIAAKDGWKYLCRDVAVFAAAVKADYPAPTDNPLPYILMGHSMGSFVVRVATASFDAKPDKLIVMGTGGPNPLATVGIGIARVIKTFRGAHHLSPLMDKLTFGHFNQRFDHERDSHAWLTTDTAIRRKYAADPLCMFGFSISAMEDLITLNQRANTAAHFKAMDKSLPILLVSGRDDPVGDYGRGVTRVYDKLTAAGVPVTMHLYDGARHEILNDTCREQVYSDIRAFIE